MALIHRRCRSIRALILALLPPHFPAERATSPVEFEPGATTHEQEGVGTVIASLGTDSGYVPYTAYCTKSGYLSEHPNHSGIHKRTATWNGIYVHSHTPEEIAAAVIAPQFPESDLETITMIVARYAARIRGKKIRSLSKELRAATGYTDRCGRAGIARAI